MKLVSLMYHVFIYVCHLEKLKETIEEKKKEQEVCNTKIKDLEANLADAKGYRDRQLKEAKEHMQKMKEKSEKSRKEWEKHEKVDKLNYLLTNSILLLLKFLLKLFGILGCGNTSLGS